MPVKNRQLEQMNKKQPKKENEKSFKKGVSGNPAGRPKGSLNKTTVAQRATLQMVMDNLAETILSDLALVTPSRRLEIYKELTGYFTPKLSSNKNENSNEISGDININISWEDEEVKDGGADE